MDIAMLQKTIQSTIKNQGVIDLRNQKIDDNLIQVLKNTKTDNVMKVYLSKNKITPIGIQYLSQCKWSSLFDLSLMSNLIKDKGCKYLTKVSMPIIRLIALDSNEIGDAGMSHLSKAQWKTLEDGFSISDNKLRNDGVKLFCKANWLRIRRIDISKNKINKYQARNLILTQLKQVVLLNLRKTVIIQGYSLLSDYNVLLYQPIENKFCRQNAQFYYFMGS